MLVRGSQISTYFSAYLRIVVKHIRSIGKKVFKVWITQLAFIDVRHFCVGWPCDVWKAGPQIFVLVGVVVVLYRCPPRNVVVDVAALLCDDFRCGGGSGSARGLELGFDKTWSHGGERWCAGSQCDGCALRVLGRRFSTLASGACNYRSCVGARCSSG